MCLMQQVPAIGTQNTNQYIPIAFLKKCYMISDLPVMHSLPDEYVQAHQFHNQGLVNTLISSV